MQQHQRRISNDLERFVAAEIADVEVDSSINISNQGSEIDFADHHHNPIHLETVRVSEIIEDSNPVTLPNDVNALHPSGTKENIEEIAEIRQPLFDDGDNSIVSIRSAVQNFYKKYNPEKLNTIDNILQQYSGFEIQLVLHLIQKYNAADKSDLDIFAGSLSEKDLDEVAKHQIELLKIVCPNGNFSDSEVCNGGEKEDDKDCSPIKSQQSLEYLKGSINGHIGSAKQSLISSNIQDISSNFAGRFLTSWNTATTTSMPSSTTKPIPLYPPSILSPLSPMGYTKDEISTTGNSKVIQPSTILNEELSQISKLSVLQTEIQSIEASKIHLNSANRALKLQVEWNGSLDRVQFI